MSSESADEPGWDVSPEDEIAPVVEATGRQVRLWREAAGMRVVEFGRAIGYGEDLVRKVERGARIPRADFLDRADDVLNAGGRLRAFKEDMEKARYPKKVRELKMLEERAVELLLYSNHNIHGLLQSEEYARALFGTWRPAYSPDELQRMVAARLARKSVFERSPAPELSFVQEEATLRRPVGGTMVWRQQLTSAGGRAVAPRHASGDADAFRRPPWAERKDRGAEVPGRHGCWPFRRGVQRPTGLRSEAATDP